MESKARAPRPEDNEQIYVTLNSARKASYELAAIAMYRQMRETEKNRKQIISEIIDTYLPFAKPNGKEELANLRLVTDIDIHCCNGEERRYYYLNFNSIHEPIKPVQNGVEVSLTYYLAITAIDEQINKMKAQQELLADRIFTEIMFMRDKCHIEACFPQAMEYLQFEPFCYDTMYYQDICSEERKAEYRNRE